MEEGIVFLGTQLAIITRHIAKTNPEVVGEITDMWESLEGITDKETITEECNKLRTFCHIVKREGRRVR